MGTVYELYMVKPGAAGTFESELSARYELHEGAIRVLLDRFGHLHEVADGPLTPRARSILASFARASYYELREAGGEEAGV